MSCLHVWWQQIVVVVDMAWVVVVYGSRRMALTFFPIHSFGTSIRADVAQGLTVFSITS
jgi:hypothetical protein